MSLNSALALELADVETLFLDAGNTLISLDYSRVLAELGRAGLDVDRDDFERAEAAARPEISAHMAGVSGQSSLEAFTFYLERVVERLSGAPSLTAGERSRRVTSAARRLKAPGQDFKLWSWVMPGVEGALASLRALGIRLVVVSNSDGSVERALSELGLSAHLSQILDSAIVGFEKPDPKFFEHALGVSGARRETTVHVGDMYFQDVIGARAAGIAAVLLDPYDDWQIEDCWRCRSLAELAEHLLAAKS